MAAGEWPTGETCTLILEAHTAMGLWKEGRRTSRATDEGERRSGHSVHVLSFSYWLLLEDRMQEERGKGEEEEEEEEGEKEADERGKSFCVSERGELKKPVERLVIIFPSKD